MVGVDSGIVEQHFDDVGMGTWDASGGKQWVCKKI